MPAVPHTESPTESRAGIRSSFFDSARRATRLAPVICLLIYSILATGTALTFLPWCDEGWFSSPALNLLTKGEMGTSVLDETSTFRTVRLEGIEHHTYWIMPLYPLVQVAWYTVVGFGLTQMRILSVVCGGVALLAWFLFVRKVTGDRTLALATLAFMCVDFQFVCASSVGRMDILCVALGFAAFAVYAVLRERHHTFAVLASNTLIAAAVMAHPLSALLFVNLWLLTALLDRARIRVGLLLKAAIPYLLGFAGWAHYILASPAEFLAQFSGNAGFGSRFSLFLQPWDTIIGEITVRYLKNFGMPPHSQGFSQLKLLILAAYIAGAAGVIAWPKLHSYVRQRPIAAIAYAQILLLPVIDGLHQHLYLVYVVPMFATLWAVLYVHAWRDWKRFRPVLAVVGAVLIAVQFGVHFSRMRQNGRSNRYVPAARFVQGMAHGRSVMGSAELAFELGFSGRLIDDWRLGYRSGKRPDVLVVDEPRYAQWIALLEEREPDNYRYIQTLLKNDYSLVYDRPGYKIYDRKLAQGADEMP